MKRHSVAIPVIISVFVMAINASEAGPQQRYTPGMHFKFHSGSEGEQKRTHEQTSAAASSPLSLTGTSPEEIDYSQQDPDEIRKKYLEGLSPESAATVEAMLKEYDSGKRKIPSDLPFLPTSFSMQERYPERRKPRVSKKPLDKALIEQVIGSNPPVIELVEKIKRRVPAYPKSILLYGPPGTGKTTLVRAIAELTGRECFMYSAAELSDRFQNSGRENLEDIFAEAVRLKKPCIIAIDELQILINKHNNPRLEDSSLLTQLWQLLDDYVDGQIIFIATANYIENAPDNILGRFKDNMFEISFPSEEQRGEIIEFYFKKMGFGFNSAEGADAVAKDTLNFSHRNLEALVESVVSAAYVRSGSGKATIRDRDWADAIERIRFAQDNIKKHATRTPESEILALQKAGVILHKIAFEKQHNYSYLSEEHKAQADKLKFINHIKI